MAPKILVYGDACAPTGFERVIRGIMNHLHGAEGMDVTVMGINYRADPKFKYGYQVYPCTNDPGGDPLGVMGLNDALKRHRPDVLFILQDLWNITTYLSHREAQYASMPTVVYFPVDTPNMKWGYAVALGAVSRPVAYTDYGARETAAGVRDALDAILSSAKAGNHDLSVPRHWMSVPHPSGAKLHARVDRLQRFQNASGLTVIPHGFDAGLFQPRDRAAARERFGIPADAFVVGNVNTNQFRKRQDLTMRAFAYLADRRPNAFLVLHCAGPSLVGWDLEQLARLHGISDRTLLVHQTVEDDLDEDALVDLYNTFDVQINTAGGEGWGLTSFEGAACGVPQLVPDWSVTRDLWKDAGVLLPVSDWRYEPKYLNTAHCIVDAKAAGDRLWHLSFDEALRERYRTAGLELVARQWTWPQVGAAFAKEIQAAISEPSARPVPLDELVAARDGELRSEMYGALYMQDGKIVRRQGLP